MLPKWGTFEIENFCKKCNIELNCDVKFDSNGTVTSFGNVTRGNLESDVDIAGKGIVISFFVPSVFALVISFFMILSLSCHRKPPKNGRNKRYVPRPGPRGPREQPADVPERVYNFLESALCTISDIQIFLALALAVSFVLIDSCKKLQYHFEVGINLCLVACTNYLQALALVRRYWRKSWIASLLRLGAVAVIFAFLGWILTIQNGEPFSRSHPFVPERVPQQNKKDSVIFLKAACFLDPDFQRTVFDPLTVQQRELIGLEGNKGTAWEWIFWILLVVATALVFIIRGLCGLSRCRTEDKPPPTNMAGGSKFDYLYWAMIWLLSLAVLICSAYTVTGLRSWVSQSGWLKVEEMGNPEDDIRGFGQVALLTMVAAVIAMLDRLSHDGKPHVRPGSNC